MPLTDAAIRKEKPGEKPKKMFDERGLFLLVQPSGGKLWRLKYRYLGKEKKLALGRYPDVSLKLARERRAEARAMLANGADPASVKAALAGEKKEAAANTFSSIALVICPLLSGPISALELVTKEEWNGEEAQAGGDHRQVA